MGSNIRKLNSILYRGNCALFTSDDVNLLRAIHDDMGGKELRGGEQEYLQKRSNDFKGTGRAIMVPRVADFRRKDNSLLDELKKTSS